MIPRYGEWFRSLRSQGLSVVGVHSPETEQEADRRRIGSYVRANRIYWPVVLDLALEAWHRYHLRAWPTILLIDRAGVVRDAFVGDGRSAAIESKLKELLSEPVPAASRARARAVDGG